MPEPLILEVELAPGKRRNIWDEHSKRADEFYKRQQEGAKRAGIAAVDCREILWLQVGGSTR